MSEEKVVDMSRLTVRTGTKSSYDIVYKNSFEALSAEVGSLYPDKVNVCVITDSNVDPLYGEEVVSKLEEKRTRILMRLRRFINISSRISLTGNLFLLRLAAA